MEHLINNHREKVINYLTLRQVIGFIGIATPFILPLGTFLFSSQSALQISISHYYYSAVHVVFVGVLCLLSGFLLTYRGVYRLENRVSNFAGVFSLGVATFPTDRTGFQTVEEFMLNNYKDEFDIVHHICAAALFICFAIFCLVIFQNSDDGIETFDFDKYKIRRNKFYKTCGIIIGISILIIGGIWLLKLKRTHQNDFIKYSTLIFETTSLLAFGASWLIKGSFLWVNSKYLILRLMANYFRGKAEITNPTTI